MADGHTFKGYLPGGASGGILPAEKDNIPLDFGTLEEYGCLAGSGAVIILSEQDNIANAALNLMRFYQHESCGQCTPCRAGCEKSVKLMESGPWCKIGVARTKEVTMRDPKIRPRRSLLFVPGLRPDRFSKALESGADIVCVDIEDAVPLSRKQEARDLTLPLLADEHSADVEIMVRVNPLSTPDGLRDILALRNSNVPPKAIMLAKPGSSAEIRLYDELL